MTATDTADGGATPGDLPEPAAGPGAAAMCLAPRPGFDAIQSQSQSSRRRVARSVLANVYPRPRHARPSRQPSPSPPPGSRTELARSCRQGADCPGNLDSTNASSPRPTSNHAHARRASSSAHPSVRRAEQVPIVATGSLLQTYVESVWKARMFATYVMRV